MYNLSVFSQLSCIFFFCKFYLVLALLFLDKANQVNNAFAIISIITRTLSVPIVSYNF